MITNKDLSIDSENGKITLNGNKYDLGTQGEIDTAVKGVYSVMGQMGAKNLIPYPYYNGDSYSTNGITFTVNTDNSITISGTASATAIFRLSYYSDGLHIHLNAGKYILSASGQNDIKYQLRDSTNNTIAKAITSDVTVTVSEGNYDVVIQVSNGATYTTPYTIYPMLRLAADTDETYQPYAKTNKELTEVIGDLSQTSITGASVADQLGALDTTLDAIHPSSDRVSAEVFESNSAADIVIILNETGNDDYKGMIVKDKDGNERYRLYFTGGHVKFLSKAADGTTIVDTTLA